MAKHYRINWYFLKEAEIGKFMPKMVKFSTWGYEMQNLRCKFAEVQGHFNQ